jgi:undecaprenyl-diphosphatase
MLLFATINAYSRVYMGVHFISDVVAGALTGALIGFAVYGLYDFCRIKYLKPEQTGAKKSLYPAKNIRFLSAAYVFIVIFLLFYSLKLSKYP